MSVYREREQTRNKEGAIEIKLTINIICRYIRRYLFIINCSENVIVLVVFVEEEIRKYYYIILKFY